MQLNKEQTRATHVKDGPLLIMAGAGSGKTRTLIARIDCLIKQNVKPQQILAITFTNKAANELKARLSPQARGVTACTIHSFCVRILRNHATQIGFKPGFSIIDTDDQKKIINGIKKELVDNDPKKKIIKKIRSSKLANLISDAKNKNIKARDYVKSDNNRSQINSYLIQNIYQTYQDTMHEMNVMDFDDLLMYTIDLFKLHPETLDMLQDQYRYINVDEYQDTNAIQDQLVTMLAHKYQNICVVGDPDQSIYGWRGAEIKNINTFAKRWEHTNVVELNRNYRSTQPILDISNSIIHKNNSARKSNLISNIKANKNPIYIQTSDSDDEAREVVNRIQILKNNGNNFHDIAILYRSNAYSRIIEKELVYRNIPYTIVGHIDFYQRAEIKDLMAYLTLLANPYNEMALKRIINTPARGIGVRTMQKISNLAREKQMPILMALTYADSINLTARAKTNIRSFLNLYNNIDAKANCSLKTLLQYFIDKTEYADYLEDIEDETSRDNKKKNVTTFLNQIDQYDKTTDIKNEPLNQRLTHFLENIALVANTEKEKDQDLVTLMTVHSAKGLEYPYVFVIGLNEGVFPSNPAIQNDTIEEERRLMYVAITRAEKQVYLTSATRVSIFGSYERSTPSRFISEIDDDSIIKLKTRKAELEEEKTSRW